MAVPSLAAEDQSVWVNFNTFPMEDSYGSFTVNNSGVTQNGAYPSYSVSGDGATHSGEIGFGDQASIAKDSYDISAFTVCAWFNRTGTSTYQYAVTTTNQANAGNARMILGKRQSNWHFLLLEGGNYDILTGTLPATNTWFHSCGTWDGTTMKLYMNGVLADTGTPSINNANLVTLMDSPLTINSYYGSTANHYEGTIDDLQWFNKTLSATNITYLYEYGTFAIAPSTGPFNVTAYDAEKATQILTFNTTLNGTTYSTTNGTIVVNTSGFYNTTIEAPGYITVDTSRTYLPSSTTQWNLTSILRNVTLQAYSNDTSQILTFNVTVDSDNYTTTNGTVKAEMDRTVLHNLTFTATGFYPNVTTGFNATSNFNATLFSATKNVTVTATNFSGDAISDFNVTVNGVTTLVGTSANFILDTRELHNFTFSKYNYFGDSINNVNVSTTSSVTGNLTQYFNILVGTETVTPGDVNYTFSWLNFSNTPYTDVTLNYTVNQSINPQNGAVPSYNISGSGAPYSAEVDSSNVISLSKQSYDAGNFTVCAWYNRTGTSTFQYATTMVDVGNVGNYRIIQGKYNTNWIFLIVDDVSGAVDWLNTSLPATNTWFHSCMQYDGNNMNLYVDGALAASKTPDADPTLLRSRIDSPVTVSGYYNQVGNRYTGTIDDLQVHSGNLSLANIQQIYNYGSLDVTAGNGSVVSNSTDQYSVQWNGSTYYPEAADNKTYLPVRFTLEDFNVTPFSPEFKQAVFLSYNTTNHLSFNFNNSHAVTATNRYDSSSISNFTVNVSGTLYTANGTTAYLQNETGIVNYTVTKADFFPAYGVNVNVTDGSSSVQMHQVEVRFNGTQRFTGNAVTAGNVTLPDGSGGVITKAFNETFYLNAGNYTAEYSSAFDEAKNQNFSFTALENTTRTISNITNANLSITGINAVDGSPIPFFSTTVVNGTLFINLSKTEASPHLYNLIQNVTYNVTFDNSSFALNDTNITLTNRSSSYVFYVYTTNSFNISILNELTQDQINDTNFTVEFIGSYESYNTTYNGSLYIDLVVPDTYQIRYKWMNQSTATDYGMQRQYYYELTNRSYNPVNLYALNNSVSDEIEITVQNADTLQREEGVVVLLQRFYIDSNSYETVAMYQTDSQGKAFFDVEKFDELYRFALQSPFGTTIRTTEPAYLHEDSYIIYTTSTVENIERAIDFGALNATFDWNNATQTLTVNYADPAALYSQYQLNLYEKGTYSNTLINTSTGTSSTGSLVVSYAFANDTEYIGTLSVSNSPAIEIARFSILDFVETQPLTNLSLFLVSILFTIMVFVSAFSLYSVVVGAVALVAAQVMGLLTFSTPVVGMILFGAIFLAVILEWRRG